MLRPEDIAAAQMMGQGGPGMMMDGGQPPVEPLPGDPNAQPTGAAIDWNSQDNPFLQKFTGLQGNFKVLKEQLQMTQSQFDALLQRQMQQEMAAEGMTPDQIAIVSSAIKAEKSAKDKEAQLEEAMQQLGPTAQQHILNQIATKYGIDASVLQDAPGPEAAAFAAAKLATMSKKETLQARKASGTDLGESGGGGAPRDYSKLSAREKIAEGLRLNR